MKKSTKEAVILGGIAAAGVAFWYFFFGPGASSTSSPGAASSPAVSPWANPVNAAEVDVVTSWINSFTPANATNAQQWIKYMQTRATQQDIDTMSTLIVQYWDQNIAPPYALDNYFTALAAKVNSVTLP